MRWALLSLLCACSAAAPAAQVAPKPKADAPPPDPTADCAALSDIMTGLEPPAGEAPQEAALVRYYGAGAKAFRDVRLDVPELALAAKEIATLFTTLGSRAEAIAKARTTLDTTMSARLRAMNDVYEAMRAIWNLRDYCESASCKQIFEVEKRHHAIVRVPFDDKTALAAAVRAFRADVTEVPASDRFVGFARTNMDRALGSYEETSNRFADARAAHDNLVNAKESRLLKGRLAAFCPAFAD